VGRITPSPDPLAPQRLVGHGPFKCPYCARYGQPGACEGCGAPNAPATIAHIPTAPRRPDVIQFVPPPPVPPRRSHDPGRIIGGWRW
jgi:hypothetical protein